MSVTERRWTIKVCRECGGNVHTDACRYTGPLTNAPGDEVEVVPSTDYRGAVDATRSAVESLVIADELLFRGDTEAAREHVSAALATLRGQ